MGEKDSEGNIERKHGKNGNLLLEQPPTYTKGV